MQLEVTVKGQPDALTGLVIDRDQMDKIINENIIKYDKANLSHHFPLTTGEALSNEFYKILKASALGPCLVQVSIQETKENRFLAGIFK